MRGMRRAIISLLLLTSCGRLQEQDRKAPEAATAPVRIGIITSATGPLAAFGEASRLGGMMAAEEHHLNVVVEDDQGRPEQSANAAERLVTGAGVVAIACCDTSGETMAASPICEREHVAMISGTASAPIVTRGKRYMFRVCATDDFEARLAARLAGERLHAKRVAILRDTKNDYSVGMTGVFIETFTGTGATVTGTFDYSEGDSDFRSQLTAAAASKPDAIFLPGYYADVAQIVSQARDLTIAVPLFGGSGWDSPKLVEIGGKAVEGCWFVSGVRSASPQFVENFRKRYGRDPDSANAQVYDAVSIVAKAIEAGGNDRQKVRDAIAATRNFPGASGPITIGPDGNARKPLGVFRVVGGKFVQEGVIEF
jgi:branched-chain amino acid transport system substrate-binding protein